MKIEEFKESELKELELKIGIARFWIYCERWKNLKFNFYFNIWTIKIEGIMKVTVKTKEKTLDAIGVDLEHKQNG